MKRAKRDRSYLWKLQWVVKVEWITKDKARIIYPWPIFAK